MRLSDYKDEEAITLWAKLIDPFVTILADKDIAKSVRARKPMLVKAKEIAEKYPKEALKVLTTIDPTPVDGANLILRLLDLLQDIETNPMAKSFFASVAEDAKQLTPSGSAMGNIEGNPDTSSDM